MKRIYLAGPEVFLPEPNAAADRMHTILRRLGLKGLFPLDNALHLADLAPADAAQSIFKANRELLDQADGVLASMRPFRGPSMDIGTGWEMGYAAGKGLPVIGYWSPDPKTIRSALHLPCRAEDGKQPMTYRERVAFGEGSLTETGLVARDRDGWAVEDFGLPDNLMVICGAESIHDNFEAAAEHMARRFNR